MGNIIEKKNSDFVAFLRLHLKCDDNNMFVTNFVENAYIDLYEMGLLEDLKEEDLWSGIKALVGFRDKNQPAGVPVYNFWP